MKVHLKHGKVTQIMHGASINYRYVWDVSVLNIKRVKTIIMYASASVTGYAMILARHVEIIRAMLIRPKRIYNFCLLHA